MRDALIFALLLAVAVLGYLLHSQNNVLTDQQRQIKDLSAKIEPRSKSASLELQEACSKQARQEFESNGWKREQFALFTNHYNEKMNKCFIMIENTTEVKPRDGTLFTSKILYDAFEGKSYGEYNWRSDKVKKFWEVPPFNCKGTLLSGEEEVCHSSDEFDEIVKLYMR
jgi:hypothetical protein